MIELHAYRVAFVGSLIIIGLIVAGFVSNV